MSRALFDSGRVKGISKKAQRTFGDKNARVCIHLNEGGRFILILPNIGAPLTKRNLCDLLVATSIGAIPLNVFLEAAELSFKTTSQKFMATDLDEWLKDQVFWYQYMGYVVPLTSSKANRDSIIDTAGNFLQLHPNEADEFRAIIAHELQIAPKDDSQLSGFLSLQLQVLFTIVMRSDLSELSSAAYHIQGAISEEDFQSGLGKLSLEDAEYRSFAMGVHTINGKMWTILRTGRGIEDSSRRRELINKLGELLVERVKVLS